jgi:tRNA (guanine-N7-)-methyltransferase
MKRYAQLLKPGGVVHIKHDNPGIYERALIEIPQMGGVIVHHDSNIYESGFLSTIPAELREVLEIRTYYEQMWLNEGRKIKYIQAIMPLKK